ncbi:DUF4190 domain-containing protein [Candidatus Woesearchaeota archaeon]|nr:MAG: DUF4190 domain-containing protein [Candidatus Woesearchaeota archaeon]
MAKKKSSVPKKKPVKTKKAVKKTVKKAVSKPVQAATQSYMEKNEMSTEKPKSMSEFDKELEETAKLLTKPEITAQQPAQTTPTNTQTTEIAPHDKTAIHSTVFGILGIILFPFSIVGIILGAKAVKQGSHTGKGAILLSILTLILNLILIYIFLTAV